jgi:hypothetical protein
VPFLGHNCPDERRASPKRQDCVESSCAGVLSALWESASVGIMVRRIPMGGGASIGLNRCVSEKIDHR